MIVDGKSRETTVYICFVGETTPMRVSCVVEIDNTDKYVVFHRRLGKGWVTVNKEQIKYYETNGWSEA